MRGREDGEGKERGGGWVRLHACGTIGVVSARVCPVFFGPAFRTDRDGRREGGREREAGREGRPTRE
jgi:hypothetical protein